MHAFFFKNTLKFQADKGKRNLKWGKIPLKCMILYYLGPPISVMGVLS